MGTKPPKQRVMLDAVRTVVLKIEDGETVTVGDTPLDAEQEEAFLWGLHTGLTLDKPTSERVIIPQGDDD